MLGRRPPRAAASDGLGAAFSKLFEDVFHQ